jgi:hypothetical protein
LEIYGELYTIRESDVTSKIGDGEYGLRLLPDRWHLLIREAVAIKGGKTVSEYGSQLTRLRDFVGLFKWFHAESNRLLREMRHK